MTIKRDKELIEDLVNKGLDNDILAKFVENNQDLITPESEVVNHPNHYTNGRFETIEIIEEVVRGYGDSFVGYCVGNTQKYIARAPFKHDSPLEDLKKARKYLDFAIDRLERLEAEDGANPEDFIFNGADVDGDEDTFVNLNEDDKSINECVKCDGDEDTFVNLNEDDKSINECVRCDGYVTERELANGVNICVYCALRIVEEHLQAED